MRLGIPRDLYTINESKLYITLANGARMWFKGADKSDALYGEDVYAAVIDEASRCFVAGTLVDTPSGPRSIDSLRVGDAVLNASGIGFVRRTIHKKAKSLVAVMIQGCGIVSSPEHRYFTQRGWVEAQHLEPTDRLITRSEAVSLVWGDVHAPTRKAESEVLHTSLLVCGDEGSNRDTSVRLVSASVYGADTKAADAAVLRSELLCEMENVAACGTGEGLQSRSDSQIRRITSSVVGQGYASDPVHETRSSSAQCDERSIGSSQGCRILEAEWSSTTVAGWQGSWPDVSATDTLDRARQRLGLRTRSAGEPQMARYSDLFLCGRGSAIGKDCGRSGWVESSIDESSGCRPEEDSVPSGVRVDRVEVLQPGDSKFAIYSHGLDTVDVYDIAVSGHPSFAVNGLLVHNCKEEAWHALRSTLTATRGPIRIIGNVKGRRNWFYIMARKAEAGDPDMHYARITARDAVEAGVIAQAEVEDAKRQLPEAVYRELYEAEPSDDEGNPFGVDAIRACIGPLSTEPPVAYGVDLAKSHDWTVITGLDAAGRVCRLLRFQVPWEDTIARIQAEIKMQPTLVDSTGVGDPILERLQKGPGRFTGFHFSATSKQQLMEGLAVAIQQHEVTFPDGVLTNELEAFEYVYSRSGVHYSAPDGLFDDCVCSLALAWKARQRPTPDVRLIGEAGQSRAAGVRSVQVLQGRESAWR